MLKLLGIKSRQDKLIESKLDNLENGSMIDLMIHQYKRYQSVTHFTRKDSIWESWVRR